MSLLVLMSVLSRLAASHLLPLYFPFHSFSYQSNSHCRSIQRRVWLIDYISNTDYQCNMGLNHETESKTIFEQMDNFQERVSLSVSQQIPYQKSRSSSPKSKASTISTVWIITESTFDNESETLFLKQVCILIRKDPRIWSQDTNESLTEKKRDRNESISQCMRHRK